MMARFQFEIVPKGSNHNRGNVGVFEFGTLEYARQMCNRIKEYGYEIRYNRIHEVSDVLNVITYHELEENEMS